MWTTQDTAYESVLQDFQSRFNENPRAKKLVKDWDRVIVLEAMDTRSTFGLVIENQWLSEIRKISEVDSETGRVIHLQGDEAVLKMVFSGNYNPATALTDGALAVFSPDRDKVKLEALAMVIWRLG